MKNYYDEIIELCQAVMGGENVIKATKYISPKLILRAVRKTYKAYKLGSRKGDNVEVHLTIGKPNYLEREFIKLCQKAHEPFPVKKVQLKFHNPKPRKLTPKK